MEELEIGNDYFSTIDNIEDQIKLIKEKYIQQNIEISSIKVISYSSGYFYLKYFRELTEELKEEIRIKKEADLIKQQERLKALSEKMSKAAKKGWIKRHERETEEREKRNEAARKYAEKQLIKRQAKEAEKLRIQQEKDFLHKLLYEEE